MKEQCHVCGCPELVAFPLFSQLQQVTSDCRPYPQNGALCACSRCGVVQKLVTDGFLEACDAIYASYTMYQQSGGVEQQVFSQDDGAGKARSLKVLEAVAAKGLLPEKGNLLDVGCGNGGMLKSFGGLRPGWTMWGCELHDHNKAVIESLPGVAGLHVGDVAGLDESFDLVCSIHSLEHIVSPLGFLETLRSKLKPGGALLIDVPHFMDSPFDLVVADHVTHFNQDSLERLVTAAGFDIEYSSDSAVPKELVLLARRTEREAVPMSEGRAPGEDVESCLGWLKEMVRQAKVETSGPLGVFGTAIAGAWVLSEMGDAIAFFVDEDPARVGKEFHGVPVVSPSEVKEGAVLVPFSAELAASIVNRLAGKLPRAVIPPKR